MYGNASLNYWPQLQSPCTSHIAPSVIQMGTSLWYSTDCDAGSCGMVEYDIETNSIKSVVKYRGGCEPKGHCICKLGRDILIIDGVKGQIFAFRPKNKKFIRKCAMPPTGNLASCVALHGDVHIFNGYTNETGAHLIYCGATNKVRALKDHRAGRGYIHESVTAWNGHILRFGGCNARTKEALCDFWMSPKLRADATPSPTLRGYKWTKKKSCVLPYGFIACGHVVWRQWLLLFGGQFGPAQFSNDVYVLNLAQIGKGGARWTKLHHLECPFRSRFHAVLHRQQLHLFQILSLNDEWRGHYTLSVPEILGGLYDADSSYVPSEPIHPAPAPVQGQGHDRNLNEQQQRSLLHHHAHAQPQSQIRVQTQKQGQKSKHAVLECIGCTAMRDRVGRSEAECRLLQNVVAEKEAEIEGLRVSVERLTAALSQKGTECEQFKILNRTLSDEFKELSMELRSTRLELRRATTVIDPTKYQQWTPSEVVDWIVSLEPNKLRKYEKTLRAQFEKEGVNGMAIEYVDKPSLLGWGVENFMDRVQIEKGIQLLVQQHGANGNGQSSPYHHQPPYAPQQHQHQHHPQRGANDMIFDEGPGSTPFR